MENLLYIVLLSFGSIIALFLLTKLMGYRQLSEMSMFDYVNGITIGSIAAEMATSLEDNFTQPLTAMVVYAVVTTLLSIAGSKWIKLRRFISGKPFVLLNNGELYRKNLKRARIDINEFLTQARVCGYFDISKLESAVLEDNGKISFLPKSKERPITPGDLNLNPTSEHLVANVILDGHILEQNLKVTGNDKNWLLNKLKAQNVKGIEHVLLATCDYQNTLNVYLKEVEKLPSDVLI